MGNRGAGRGEREMDHINEYAHRIHRVVAALSARVTAADVAEALVHEVAAVLEACAAAVFLFDDERNRLVRTFGYPAGVPERWTEAPISSSPLLSGVRAGELAFTPSRLRDARFDASLSSVFGDGADVVAPMAAGGRVLGCLAISYDRVREFPPAELEFITTLAAHCAQSFERARLFEAERAARDAADAARRQLAAVIEQLPAGVSIIGKDRSLVMNALAIEIFGARRISELPDDERFAGRMKHLDGRDYAIAELPITRALQGGTVAGEEMLITRSDDTRERRLRVNAAPIRKPDGGIDYAVAMPGGWSTSIPTTATP